MQVKEIMIPILIIIGFPIICKLIGVFKVKLEIKSIKNMDPYIYYRELPNNYGIGVTSLLFDSNIENYKDIVAIILDLCARKYLKLIKQGDKYLIQILKPEDDNLLSNEKYILRLITKNDIKNIDYKLWYDMCFFDGKRLGVYAEPKKIKESKLRKTIVITVCLLWIIIIIYGCKKLIDILPDETIAIIFSGLFIAGLGCRILPEGMSFYRYEQEKNLYRTSKGKKELLKLNAFKAFINDFGNFVGKNAEEVELWDRYLSYAQVFGLTKQLMKTGYKQLVENSSFIIDDIENINLNNIEVIK